MASDKTLTPVQFWDTDIVGQRIKVGDIIAYGHALGRCAGLRIGKVLAINTFEERRYRYSTSNHEMQTCAHFTVWGVERGWGDEHATLCKTKGTLQFDDRIVVLQPSQVKNKAIVDLLELVALDKTFKQIENQIASLHKNIDSKEEMREIFAPLIEHAHTLGLDKD